MRFEATTQSISWFQKEYKGGSLTLRPPYQRKPVWAIRQKCYLIESILVGFPVPEIFIHEVTGPNGETSHAVVDGQQRIRTILQFIGLETTSPDGTPETDESEFVGFALDKFEQRSEQSAWYGKRFTDLTPDERKRLYEYPLHVRSLYVSEGSGESELREMFRRLNRFLTALNGQELRHATYVGPFAKQVESLADDDYWLTSRLVTRALVRRLGDVEFVGQLLIGTLFGPQGGSGASVDEYYRQFEDYEDEEGFPDQRRGVALFNSARSQIQALFPDLGQDSTLRWSNRADYYSLFVAVAALNEEYGPLKGAQMKTVRDGLVEFSADVNRRLANESARANAGVVSYVRAVEKGVNDKARRAERHRILLELIETMTGLSRKVAKVAKVTKSAKSATK